MSMKLSKKGLVGRVDFVKLVKSIGFIKNNNIGYYSYKQFHIDLFYTHYDFWNGSVWIFKLSYDNLEQIDKHFKMELRSVKLKELIK